MEYSGEKSWVNLTLSTLGRTASLPDRYDFQHQHGSPYNRYIFDEPDFNRHFFDHQRSPVLVPPKFRGTPLDVLPYLHGPYGIDLTNRGLLAVSEFTDHKVSLWDLRSSKKVSSFGTCGSAMGQFLFPSGIAVTPRDNILVVDCYNDRIQEMTLDGQCISCVGEPGHDILQFDKPRGIAFDSTGLVFVADRYNHRVQVLNPDLTFSHSFGSFGVKPGRFNTPYDMSFDSRGCVYVTDCGNNRIQKFTREGRFVSVFGTVGKGKGELNGPAGIAVEDDTGIIYVTEYLNGRISMYTLQGNFVDVIQQKKLKDPYGVKCNSQTGHLMITDFSRNRLIILERKG